MARFLLIHGAWHGAWCWEKVVPLLEAKGHRAWAIDLPGHGADPTPPGEVTLKAYTDRIGAALAEWGGPAILVGHSMGGVPIAQSAEQWPERVEALVYLTAFLLQDGQRMADVRPSAPGAPPPPYLEVSADGTFTRFRAEMARDLFYHRCAPEDAARAESRLGPQPSSIGQTPLRLTPERWGRVPRYYIQCLDDRAVPIALQRQMLEAVPCRRVFSLDADHSAFYSAPEALVAILDEVAKTTRG
ncbi:MAG: alpha/beta fold hydrolase [Firmicutes bacterium]|nr:alpha/beta fold hydrolase [Alicyclobacillaceae bacterium]MCL6497059.1 alpha/beta fold hydrolase [Bacillota bacterium]